MSDEDYEHSSSENESEQSGTESENLKLGKRKQTQGLKQLKKKKKKELFKQPTTEELNRLRETENLYNSNLIRLQIEELLTQISLKEKHTNQFENWWDNFSNIINNLCNEEDVNLNDIKQYPGTKLKKKQKFLNTLFENKTSLNADRDFILKFPQPKSCTVFGEYKVKCLIKNDMNININIRMPSDCFSVKDYLNNRYFIKKHYYLIYILYHIRQKIPKVELLYKNFNFLPFLRIRPEYSEKVTINVFVTGPEDFFSLKRFLPDKNNIKYEFDDNFNDIDIKSFAEVPTPMHNSFLVKDFTLNTNYTYIESLLDVKYVQDAIKLLNLWLTQRELNKGFGNFTNELLLYTITYLAKKKKINSFMSSYQVMRIFWSFITSTNWHQDPISLCDDVKANVLDMYKKNYDVVFLDLSGYYNVASFLQLDLYLKIKQEAQLALNILDNNKFNSFTSLFLMKVPFSLQYDALIKLKSDDNFKNIYETISSEDKWKHYGLYNYLILNKITNILHEAFTKRVTNIVPYFQEQHTEYEKSIDSYVLIFGINLNPEHAFNVIEKGPSENEPEKIKQFQEFWKGLTSFRRFQDSTAAEVVYFSCRTLQDKRNIFIEIVEFILAKRYRIDTQIICNQFERLLKLKNTITHFPTGTNEEASLKVIHIFNDLNKKLRSLELPLMITNIQGTSNVFRYTDVFPPIPTTYREDRNTFDSKENILILKSNPKCCPAYVYPIECVIQLNKSSGWPNDVKVLRCMKAEFYIRLSELLEIDHDIISSVTLNHLDIFYEGLVFRVKLFIPKELTLLKKTTNSENIISYKDNEESLRLERDLEILPKITSALSGIHQKHPSFGPSCALIKRWLRSQLIDNYHISDTVIDLWNASLYLNDPPFAIANLPQVAFLRFLKYLMDFNCQLNAVVVNFNDEIEGANLSEMETKFVENRNNYPSLYIITPYDHGKSVFTKNNPSKHVLRRICALATEAYKFINNLITNWKEFPITDIFKPNLDGYDVIIHLNSELNPFSNQQVVIDKDLDKRFIEPYKKKNCKKVPVIDFNMVDKYLSELREIYGEYAIFFHDFYGGDVIGMLWNKQITEPREFKVSHVNGKKLVNGKLEMNYDAILEDIYNRGNGLIKNLQTM